MRLCLRAMSVLISDLARVEHISFLPFYLLRVEIGPELLCLNISFSPNRAFLEICRNLNNFFTRLALPMHD